MDLDKHRQSIWQSNSRARLLALEKLSRQLYRLDVPFCIVENGSEFSIALGGAIQFLDDESDQKNNDNQYRLVGFSPVQTIKALGDSHFCQDYEIDFPYMAGSMANGIASVELVEALANEGMLASFGAAGLSLAEVETAIKHLQTSLGDKTHCYNLIYSPNEKGHEDAVVDLYLKYGVTLVELYETYFTGCTLSRERTS